MKINELTEHYNEHELKLKHGTFYYNPGKDKLPADMIQLFSALADQQRNIPEDTMYDIKNKYQLRWLGELIEHLGDLIHGFAEAVNFNGLVMRDVSRKLRSAQSTLSNLDINLKDLALTNKREAEKRNIPIEQYVQELESDLELYAAAHFQLPAYNEIHQLCKKITTSLGAMQFEECKKYIDKLLQYRDEDTLYKRSLSITRDKQGNIKRVS